MGAEAAAPAANGMVMGLAALSLTLAAAAAAGFGLYASVDSGDDVTIVGYAKPPMECPAETMYYEHHANVPKFGGYKGCVGTAGMNPCTQDGFEGLSGQTALKKPYVFNETTKTCDASGYTFSTQSFWILWGHPQDGMELKKRTGLDPVVSFPLDREPYPSYAWGSHGDDAATMLEESKDLQAYLGAFTKAELANWKVIPTEGAENSVMLMWAAKALEIARTTCHRDIKVLVEGPAYGYDDFYAYDLANKKASSFYNSSECTCFATDTCKSPTVTMKKTGWVPGTPLPTATGGYSTTTLYAADSAAKESPWIETLVFPENPSGTVKTAILPNANRRVCDGVYLWPMYFEGGVIPIDKRPDCSTWSFSITKAYSASVRAGTMMYKGDNAELHDAVMDVSGNANSIAYGLYSEWSWRGQSQIFHMMMAKPLSDPTSWVGAYTKLMQDKWAAVIDGFANCPVVSITNPNKGAYVWFKKESPYMGLETGFVTDWFLSTLGVKTTTYWWGFRGANPADLYSPSNGTAYGNYDFVRLQLYRDYSVYQEVARRAKIVCGGGKFGPYMSSEEWKTSKTSTSRRRSRALLADTYDAAEHGAEVRRHLREKLPHFPEHQIDFHAELKVESEQIDHAVETNCAPEFTMDCLFKHSAPVHSKDAADKPHPALL